MPVIQRWESGAVTLYCGDCRDILPTLDNVDAVITDPPYGIGLGTTAGTGGAHGMKIGPYATYDDTYDNFCTVVVPRLNNALDIASRGLVWTGPHIHEQRKPSVIGGVYCPAGAGRHGWGFKTFLPFLLYGNAPEIHRGAPFPTTIQSSERPTDNGHPCPKPIGWMVWCVNLASRKGETVLDCFMGSGTTGVACVRTGRKFIGIEIDPAYFEIAKRRIREAQNAAPLFEKAPKSKQLEMAI